ncbi:MAG: HIT family protein [Burkholderiaceae bacterium]|nr:HIT family protein [Burkholderiaceae bacterium]
MANATETQFGDPTTRLAQTDHWTVLLRPKQPTLGSLVLICREPVRSFAEVSVPGYTDLRDVMRCIESTLRHVVAYERINYLMLMMVDPDVHFHVIPRYQGSRQFGDVEFRDAGWPGPPALGTAISLDSAMNAELLTLLREAWLRGAG